MRWPRNRIVASTFLLVFLILSSNENVHARIILFPTSNFSSQANQVKKRSITENPDALIRDLREKTGLLSIDIVDNDELTYDRSETPLGGSTKLRALITSVISDTKNSFQIVDGSHSNDVHFSLTDQGTVDIQTGNVVYQVYFDFEDFNTSKLYSSPIARRSFSPAIVLFHELDHKVSYDSNDPIPASGVRPDRSFGNIRGVIENTNIVRAELGLIPRDEKGSHGKNYRRLINFLNISAQIPFRSYSGKRKYLRW